ncbi:MAG: malate dehydrogenase [Rhodospirillaceae bacterium]|nr:malate dehydrogenase [Rhodospirillaceae bacterium]
MREEDTEIAAHVMVETDLRGVDSHGINMLQQYEETFRRGALNIKPMTKLIRERKTTALLDADRGLGHPVSVRAMESAIEKAKTHDVGIVCVRNSHHFGAAGYYAELAAKKGMIGIVTTSTRGISMVPTRGTQPVLGTNPFALAAPAGKYPPLILDFATTIAAVNKVKVRKLRELELPEGWVNDGEGKPITDAHEALEIFASRTSGGLNPVGGVGETLGGHKGYGLAVFSHILSGAMPGASFSPERIKNQTKNSPDDLGHFFQAINPESFRPLDEYNRDVQKVIETLKGVKPQDLNKPVLVPGEPEQITRAERLKNGIPINENLREIVKKVAENASVKYLF